MSPGTGRTMPAEEHRAAIVSVTQNPPLPPGMLRDYPTGRREGGKDGGMGGEITPGLEVRGCPLGCQITAARVGCVCFVKAVAQRHDRFFYFYR